MGAAKVSVNCVFRPHLVPSRRGPPPEVCFLGWRSPQPAGFRAQQGSPVTLGRAKNGPFDPFEPPVSIPAVWPAKSVFEYNLDARKGSISPYLDSGSTWSCKGEAFAPSSMAVLVHGTPPDPPIPFPFMSPICPVVMCILHPRLILLNLRWHSVGRSFTPPSLGRLVAGWVWMGAPFAAGRL
jgi:hypothetical protein